MKIAFIPGSCVPFHGRTLDERPLGGIETAVIRLAEALDTIGHTVYVVSHLPNPPVTKPLYVPVRAIADLGTVDVLVAVRELLPLFAGVRARASFFWTGDSYDQLQNLGLGDRRVIQRLTALWSVSNWQADRLCATSGFPRECAWTIRNGFDDRLFLGSETRIPKRLIYSSTPYRGLSLLAAAFPTIRAAHPDAELHVFSGFEVYEGAGASAAEMAHRFASLFDQLSAMNGVTVRGNILQRDLAREFMRSSLLAYPNTFEETSCITAIEALAAGCPIVTSRRGALPETVGDAGILIDGNPSSKTFIEQFSRSVINILHDPTAWNTLHTRALHRSHDYSWSAIAQSLTDRLVHLFGTSGRVEARP